MAAPRGEDKKPEVTDELLTNTKNENATDPHFDKYLEENARMNRQQVRYTALNHAVQLETARHLTEDPTDITNRILLRAGKFYEYLMEDAK